MRDGRRNLIVSLVAGVLVTSGATAVAVAVAAQRHAPQPPPSAAGSLGPARAPPPPSESPRPGDAILAPRSLPDPGPKVVGPVLPQSKPVWIDIPAIRVHSTLQHLGLTAQHTLQVPVPGPHYNEAAWYKYSSTPGSSGPAVILGHVDSAAQGPSVFFNLGDLRRGNKVLVTRADGLVAVFRVDGVRRYPKDRFPTLLVYGNTDHAALRLISCGGPFDRATRHYLDNIVVFASLVGSH